MYAVNTGKQNLCLDQGWVKFSFLQAGLKILSYAEGSVSKF